MLKAKTVCSAALAVILTVSTCIPRVVATEDELSGISVHDIQPAVFSVTVPTSLPVHVDSQGQITAADTAQIVNHSNDAVHIVDIDVDAVGEYSLVGFDEDFSTKLVDSKQIAISINDSKTQSDGSFTFDSSQFSAIAPNGSQSIDYEVKATMSSTYLVGEHAANIYFTVDWYKPINLTYNANGGIFTNGTDINTLRYTHNNHYQISGTYEDPTRTNCIFNGWYNDKSFSSAFDNLIPSSDTSVYAQWATQYTVIHMLQSLDDSYKHENESVEVFTGILGETVTPAPKQYDNYFTPETQTITLDDSGNIQIIYQYSRGTYWLDVNFIVNGKEFGGGGEAGFPADLAVSFLRVIINDVWVGGGSDYCNQIAVGTKYEAQPYNLPANYYYQGTYNEGYDYWDNGTTLVRRNDTGYVHENIGMRLIINSRTDDMTRYTVRFDSNGGSGTMNDRDMVFGDDWSEIAWIPWCKMWKDGCYLAGWSLTPDGDVDFADEGRITALSNTDGDVVTLYAVWKPY